MSTAPYNKHNGQIKVSGESELGGAHFTLEFQCKQVGANFSPTPESKELLNIQGKHILILDDETSIAEFVALFLETHGAHTQHVNDKAQLKAAIEQAQHLDVFITDMILPDMTGRDAVNLVLSKFPDIKVFSMSGYVDNEEETWEYPVLRKPFNSKELSTFLNQTNS
ncbi:response regulator [Colwellia sp. MEBiC06753]